MKRSARRLLLAVVLVLVSSTSGFAQGASQSLSGVVVDAAGGVIPGASVVVLNKATGEKFELTSNEAGAFAVPGIAVGTYTVTVTLQSFKTAVINDVRIVTGTAANVRATMELGALSETVQVSSRAELVQSQSPSVASTLVAEQLNEVPLASRNALYALNMLPGVQTVRRRPARRRHQRPAEQHRQHHDRRRADRQHAAVDRRLLLDGDPAPRRGRGNHHHRRGAGLRLRAGLGAGAVRDPVGDQPVRRQRLSLLEAAGASTPTTTSTRSTACRRTRSSRTSTAAAWAARSSSRVSTTAATRRSSSSISSGSTSRRGDADAHDPATRTRRRALPLQRHVAGAQQRATVDLLALARRNGQIVDARSDDRARCSTRSAPARGTTGTINDAGRPATRSSYVYPGAGARQSVRADRPRRHQPDGQPPAERHLLVAAVHEPTRTC